jgi:hypothetical protein
MTCVSHRGTEVRRECAFVGLFIVSLSLFP